MPYREFFALFLLPGGDVAPLSADRAVGRAAFSMRPFKGCRKRRHYECRPTEKGSKERQCISTYGPSLWGEKGSCLQNSAVYIRCYIANYGRELSTGVFHSFHRFIHRLNKEKPLQTGPFAGIWQKNSKVVNRWGKLSVGLQNIFKTVIGQKRPGSFRQRVPLPAAGR